MCERAAGQFGNMNTGQHFVSRLIQCNMTIQAESEQANVNRTISRQPTLDAVAFRLLVHCIALEPFKPVTSNLEWLQKVPFEIAPARCRMFRFQPSPLINLQYPKLAAQFRCLLITFGKLFVATCRAAASRCTK